MKTDRSLGDSLRHLDARGDLTVSWFAASDCIQRRDGIAEVIVGGTLIGRYEIGDRGARNAILVGLAGDASMHLGHLADAFEISSETLRQIRRQYETEGLAEVIARAPGGSVSKLTPARRAKLTAMFEQGMTIIAVLAKVGARFGIGKSTIGSVHAAWAQGRHSGAAATTEAIAGVGAQAPLALEHVEDSVAVPTTADAPVTLTTTCEPAAISASEVEAASPVAAAHGSTDEARGADDVIESIAPVSGRFVQHVGAWLMLAMVAKLGLHRAAEEFRGDRVERDALRMAIDAVTIALSIGERCVEGVRRLATSTGSVLLRAARAPAATWVRRVLGRFARETGGARLHLRMAAGYLHSALSDASGEEPLVYYVDNHLRPYTGGAVIRRGWRMQDKRVTPGCSDYYVHDEDGRPLLRVNSPAHEPLTSMLSPIARLLRIALGDKQKILLAFDRAGAFPVQMAELRNEGFEFVTYERKPYALLLESAFKEHIHRDGERIGVHESAQKNLREGRGRVRRISLRMPNGHQVNLLAVSDQPVEFLIDTMRGRWVQENGFKHGVERWGINQLDGRTTEPYSPDDIIPNPARRRLDRAMRVARVREGDARRELARVSADDEAKRTKLNREIEEAVAMQTQLQAQRPSTPTHAPLKDTELADKLVRHDSEYKFAIDTIRVACANAESELAGELGCHLRKPAEAKRVLRNALTAPGHVRVGRRTISIDLLPAGTRTELHAIAALCATVNRMNLVLPGDPQGRRLRFRSPE